MGMLNPLARKLISAGQLNTDEARELAELGADRRRVAPGKSIVNAGDGARAVQLVISGWAARYRLSEDGNRHIVGFVLPGDFCDLHAPAMVKIDCSVVALTSCEIAAIDAVELESLAARKFEVARAIWWLTMFEAAMLRSWVVNVGSRRALAKIAHLLCEVHLRQQLIGGCHNDCFELPIRQTDLAESAGITPVHANRVIQELRAAQLIRWYQKHCYVLDLAGLRRTAEFDPSLYHLRSQ